MPGPPIRKPSDHSPPAGSPRNIAGHHVLHRPLMPRHPPNAHKNKQHNTRQNTCRRLTVRCSRPLYSSQPTHPHPPTTPNKSGAPDRSGNQGALPQNPDSMPPPHTQGHPPRHTPHTSRKQKHDRRVSYTNHQTNQPPARTNPRDTVNCPALPQGQTPQPAQTHSTVRARSKQPGSHPA